MVLCPRTDYGTDYNPTTISSEDKTIDWPTVWSIQFTKVWFL